MRIAFMGTPDFAVPSLNMLYESGHTLAVFTQPDRPVGRHGKLTPPPVKVYAEAHGIPVFQVERIKSDEGLSLLSAFEPELMVTAAFGQMLSPANLAAAPLGCINVHGSLLPKYRGAAPIQWAVIHGEAETGVTTMFTNEGMDTGDILLSASTPIEPNETAGELYERLSLLGARTLFDTLKALKSGTLTRRPQDAALATTCAPLKKEDGHIDFSLSAQVVHDRVRGTNPWPGAFAYSDGEAYKLWRTRMTDAVPQGLPGTCFGDAKSGLFITCADAALEVLELQAPGGKRMDGKSFLRGKPLAGRVLS